MKFLLLFKLLFLFISCNTESDFVSPSNNINILSTAKFNVYPQNSGRIIDQFSCVGWSELIGCPLTLKNYHNKSKVQLTAIPSENFKFLKWSGDINSSDNPIQIVINSDIKITAEFYQ
tara:strand:+ start:7816 stop:8169 length:354 start_codon:yes stop_codon:yes gene_type:complete